ncbi:permease prefix domain 1-containing protein [Paraclostridium bifermentans]|uniref:permease prefix domain 1-containing protein n=1 Tax=Paraclostridium bifermentans TaxID=1490 RepID=UPI00359C6ABC
MKIIEDYLNRIYKDDDSKEAQESKEELRQHLTTCANEFIEQGYKIEDAQNKAIEQFDGDSELSTEVNSIYKPKIDIRKERVRKLSKLRWKFINIFGWLFGAAMFTGYMNVESYIPTWLISLLVFLISILLVLSIVIYGLNKNIEKN